ncbi:MAG: GDSL-type esterase/lipase family protein [Bacteroidales bacterium]
MQAAYVTALLLFLTLSGCGQKPPLNTNVFLQAEKIPAYQSLFTKLDSIANGAPTSLTIVHIGDSHLQAGYFSEKIKAELQAYYTPMDTILSPGLIFPFALAQTNNPYYYEAKGTGQWSGYRNVEQNLPVALGMTGISITTDSSSQISIKFRNSSRTNKYAFNRIRVLGHGNAILEASTNEKTSFASGETLFIDKAMDSLQIAIDPLPGDSFVLQGLLLDYTPSRIHYHTVGVNGAQAKSYLQCQDLASQLKALNPDWVILSLGTNEAYDKSFDAATIGADLEAFIKIIEKAAPDAAKLLCTPNDHIDQNLQSNPQVMPLIAIQSSMAQKHGWALWDFYQLMGGKGSIERWAQDSLTARDRVHFNRQGYERQGEMFFEALQQSKEIWQAHY